jgi:hypothetical protein
MGGPTLYCLEMAMAFSTRSPNTPMLIVLDGMQMSDDFTLDDISAMDVESVEVLRTIAYTAIYGGVELTGYW